MIDTEYTMQLGVSSNNNPKIPDIVCVTLRLLVNVLRCSLRVIIDLKLISKICNSTHKKNNLWRKTNELFLGKTNKYFQVSNNITANHFKSENFRSKHPRQRVSYVAGSLFKTLGKIRKTWSIQQFSFSKVKQECQEKKKQEFRIF